jgi:GH24 family phage-related lysozyme (muramidase)
MNPRRLLPLLALAAVLPGCGSTRTVTVRTPPPAKAANGERLIPVGLIKLPPKESAIRPTGPGNPSAVSTPAEERLTRKVEPGETPKVGLTGSSIRIDSFGVHLVASFEGFRSCPYWDPFGSVATRGFGETDFGDTFGHRCISLSQGYRNLAYLLNARYLPAVRALGVNLNHKQVAGLGSFDYNLGSGIFTGSLRSALQHRRFHEAAGIMRGYVHAGGRVLAGLVRRRGVEARLVEDSTPECSGACLRHLRERQLRAATQNITKLRHAISALNCSHGYRGWAHPRDLVLDARRSPARHCARRLPA